MELLLAGSAAQLGELVVGSVQDVETDVAFLWLKLCQYKGNKIYVITHLNTLKPLVNISFPKFQPIKDGSILMCEESSKL